MAELAFELTKAVQKGELNIVKSLIENGANINVITSMKTPLCIAAHQGNIPMLELLLNCGRQDIDKPSKKKPHKAESGKKVNTAVRKRKTVEGNNGYYEVIYDEKPEDSESDVNRNMSLDEVETPEGMDRLEWDMELENDGTSPLYEDTWSTQYRWYAKILAKTGFVSCDLTYSCDVNLQDCVGRCAIHYAAECGHLNAVNLLLSAGCKADIGDVDSLTPLHLAANGGHLAIVETLISSGCSVNAKTTDKMTPLHYAAVRGYTDVVTALLDRGAHIDSLDEGERTPLILAVSRNFQDVAEILVKRGARVNMEDLKGHSALSEAVCNKSVSIVKLLLNAGAKIGPSSYLVHYAVLHRQPEMVVTLLEAGALVNIRNSNGETPLIIAITMSDAEMVDRLISHGAIVDYAGGSSEKNPLFHAATRSMFESPRVIHSLVEAGADLNRRTYEQTPLLAAIARGRFKTAVTLIALGADLPVIRSTLLIVSLPLTMAFVAAGYVFRHDARKEEYLPPSKGDIFGRAYSYLVHVKTNPLSLAELCRIVVRSQAVGVMSKWVSSLQIPPIISRYLMLEDIDMNYDDPGYSKPQKIMSVRL